VLIQGASGGVGLAALQLAKAAGAKVVIATSSNDARLERMRDLGMDLGINPSKSDVGEEIMRLTDGHGADLVVDSVGGRTLESSIAALAHRGRIIWVGRSARHDSPPDIWPLQQKNGSVTCMLFGGGKNQSIRIRELIGELMQRVASGELTSVIDREFPLSAADEAHRYIETRQGFGRVLLRP
jgi:NADPH2:quinone reductase